MSPALMCRMMDSESAPSRIRWNIAAASASGRDWMARKTLSKMECEVSSSLSFRLSSPCSRFKADLSDSDRTVLYSQSRSVLTHGEQLGRLASHWRTCQPDSDDCRAKKVTHLDFTASTRFASCLDDRPFWGEDRSLRSWRYCCGI